MPQISSPLVRVALVWLFILAIWLLLPALRHMVWGVEAGDYHFGAHVMSAVLATLLTVPPLIAARLWLDRQSLASMGLSLSPQAIRQVLIGAIAFLLPSALGFAIVIGFGWASIVPMAPLGEIVLFIPVLIVLVFLFEAFPEELAFRGYMQANIEGRIGYWGAIFAQSVLFAVWGGLLWTLASGSIAIDRLVMFFFIALVLGMVRGVTGSVWTSIGLHVAFQTVAQLLLNAERGHFAVEGAGMVQLVALGVVPFSLAVVIVEWLNGRKTDSPAAETLS